VLNLGIEGIMVIGAFAGWMAVYQGLPLWGGVAVAMAAGMLFGLLQSTLTVPFGLSQHVVGLGVTLLATSSASFAYRLMLPEVTSPPKIAPFQPLHVPGLSDIPWLGEALSQTALTWAAFAVAGLVALVLYRTPLGLAVRAVGRKPGGGRGAGAVGHRPADGGGDRRIGADGGGRRVPDAFGLLQLLLRDGERARLDLHRAGGVRGLEAGQGRAGRDPVRRLRRLADPAATDALGAALPYQLFLALPYLLSILALILMSRRAEVPAALMVPYNKGER
jgi:ABC-type uncharacterized transport system permease subunit